MNGRSSEFLSIPKFAVALLAEAGRPLHARDIQTEFKRRGRDVKLLSLVGALHREAKAKSGALKFLGGNKFMAREVGSTP